jgi:glycosyltransferase involved in cell wall biosynthesis
MFKILVVGTSQRKNINRIYKVASLLEEFNFIFVGNFENNLHLSNLDIKVNLSEFDLIHLYKSSDLLLFPSLTEGFGLPILEAQYFGLPVITSNREPMKSVCGINGAILVNPFSEQDIISAIFEIKNNIVLKNQLILNGQKNVLQYHISEIVSSYLNVYNSIY